MKTMYVREIQKAPALQFVEVSFTPREWEDLQTLARAISLGNCRLEVNQIMRLGGHRTIDLYGVLGRIAQASEFGGCAKTTQGPTTTQGPMSGGGGGGLGGWRSLCPPIPSTLAATSATNVNA